MILVLANRTDESAFLLAERRFHEGARIFLPDMLFAWGVGYRAGGQHRPRAIFEGDPHSSRIRGVLVRMHAVSTSDVLHTRASDRPYIATEMTAFLLAWLSALPCPVLGKPTATSLAGPELRQEEWVHLAARNGVPIHPIRRSSRHNNGEQEKPILNAVTVVDDSCIHAPTETVAQYARVMARAANARLLTTYFEGPPDQPIFVRALSWVDIDDPVIEDAVFARLNNAEMPSKEVPS